MHYDGVDKLLESLITSKTRIKLMLKFFLNPASQAYLRGLAEELGESTNSIRVELNRFTKAGLLKTEKIGRIIQYKANNNHALFPEIHSLVKKYTGIDKLIDTIINHLGDIENAFIIGDYAQGNDSGIIDLVIVGEVNRPYLQFLIDKTEGIINRRIRLLILSTKEFEQYKEKFNSELVLTLWN